jgi:hypothetical protein
MEQQRMPIGEALQGPRDIGRWTREFVRQRLDPWRTAKPRDGAGQCAADRFVVAIDHRDILARN